MIINQKSAVLEFIQGTKEDKDFYAYVLFPADLFDSLKSDIIGKEIDISQYGVVVHSDYGIEPPKGLEEKIIESFKTDFIKNNN